MSLQIAKAALTAILLFCELSSVSVASSIGNKASFGESCENLRCDSRASLTCRNEVCDCLLPDTMIYDESSSKCLVLSGERCLYTAVQTAGKEEERRWSEELACVEHAICDGGGFCSCSSDYYESKNGTCELKGDFGMACSEDRHCRVDKHLVCRNEKCVCNETDSVFDPFEMECMAKAGSFCSESFLCTGNAYCREPGRNGFSWQTSQTEPLFDEIWHDGYESYMRDLEEYYRNYIGQIRIIPQSGSGNLRRCVCKSGHFETTEGTCERMRPLESPCSDHDQCQFGLGCYEGTCQCNRNTSRFDEWSRKCVKNPGEKCYYQGSNCGSRSDCKYTGETYYVDYYGSREEYRCVCSRNSFKSINATCEPKRGFGEECVTGNECQNTTPTLKLVCKASDYCDCDVDSVYDASAKICRKLASQKCARDELCVINANCENRNYYSPGTCKCKEGFSQDPLTGQCLVDYLGTCNDQGTMPCNERYGLICKDEKCQCELEDHQYYDSRQKACKSLVKGPCRNNSSFQCTDNAECVVDDGIEECRCKRGFVPVGRICQLAYGESCHYGDNAPTCDQLGPLYCKEGICQCAAYQFYDEVQLRCRGLVGSKCDVDEEGFCGVGAFCNKFRSFKTDKRGRCQCKPGYSLVADKRECVKAPSTLIMPSSVLSQNALDGESTSKKVKDEGVLPELMMKDEDNTTIE